MPSSRSGLKPIIFLAFANDIERPLRNLVAERKGIEKKIQKAVDEDVCELIVKANITPDELIDEFIAKGDRIVIFHYAGHADEFGLFLESFNRHRQKVDGFGLVKFLSLQKRLRFVFLNACSTEDQARALLEAGIPAVAATSQIVQDHIATQFASFFYDALSAGRNLETAFDLAKAAVDTTRYDNEGIYRDVFSRENVSNYLREPWWIDTRDGAEDMMQWSLGEEASDPLFGLPSLPEETTSNFPESPYRFLEWFRYQDAGVFFGRSHEIRELYEKITAFGSHPIVLFYGQSGVGKSSLLAAGLTPRLEQVHTVKYIRRSKKLGLNGTLIEALRAKKNGNIRDAWHKLEEQGSKPVTIILDQVEEYYTSRKDRKKADEMEEFVKLLLNLFQDSILRPKGRLVLSFRKEWAPDIGKVMRDSNLPYSRLFLDRLGRKGIIEAVERPALLKWSNGQKVYSFEVEKDLGVIIADDLTEDPDSSIGPPLSIVLSKMWEKIQFGGKENTFTAKLYYGLKNDEDGLLEEFIDEQFNKLKEWDESVVSSGLALDILTFHTTKVSTGEIRSFNEIKEKYSHRLDILTELMGKLKELHFLVDVGGSKRNGEKLKDTKLSHDILARRFRNRHTISDAPGQRALRILESKVPKGTGSNKNDEVMVGDDKIIIESNDLAYVLKGESGTRMYTLREERIIEQSKKVDEVYQRRRKFILASALLFSVPIFAGIMGALTRGPISHLWGSFLQISADTFNYKVLLESSWFGFFGTYFGGVYFVILEILVFLYALPSKLRISSTLYRFLGYALVGLFWGFSMFVIIRIAFEPESLEQINWYEHNIRYGFIVTGTIWGLGMAFGYLLGNQLGNSFQAIKKNAIHMERTRVLCILFAVFMLSFVSPLVFNEFFLEYKEGMAQEAVNSLKARVWE